MKATCEIRVQPEGAKHRLTKTDSETVATWMANAKGQVLKFDAVDRGGNSYDVFVRDAMIIDVRSL